MNSWHTQINQEDKSAAYLAMETNSGLKAPDYVALLAQTAWDRREEIAQALTGADFLRYSGRTVKTIALYVHRLRCGGGARVVSLLGNMFAALKDEEGRYRYNVVIVNEEAATELDYPLSPRIIRVWIPSCDSSVRENYRPRAAAWTRIVQEYEVDAIFYSNWINQQVLWDLLTVKRTERNPAVVIHVHNWFATLYQESTDKVAELTSVFRLADGIVTLSEIDQMYWSRVNPRVYYIPNPCFTKVSETKRASFGKHILWIARIATEKQPTEIIRIMREVHARDPEIVCHIVGEDYDRLRDGLEKNVRAEGLSECVIFEGFHTDVKTVYENSSLFLMTSRFEGFPLTLYEAAVFGLPTVMYELPWLSYCTDMEGWVSVSQLDARAAAEAIVRIVNDKAEWQKRSDALYESALRYEKTDIAAHWLALLSDLEQGRNPEAPALDGTTQIMLDQIGYFHGLALQNINEKEKQLADVHASVSFRIGRAITWLPRKLRGGVRCYQEHDVKYTFERVLYHLHLGPDNDRHDR